MIKNIFFVILIKLSLSVDFILELVRHGARYPYFDIKIKNSQIKKTSLQELNYVGMKQHFLLGKQLRKNYPEIFRNKKNLQLKFISTPTNRTLTSAISQIYGIFEKNQNLKTEIENEIEEFFLPPFELKNSDKEDYHSHLKKKALPNNYLPYPIKSYYQESHFVQSKHCPKNLKKLKKEINKKNNLHSEIFENTFKSIKREFGLKIDKNDKLAFNKLHRICDTVIAHFYLNKKLDIPHNILEQCYYVESVTQYTPLENKNLKKSLFTIMWYEFKKEFDLLLKNEKKKKFTAIFAHDYVLAPFLYILEKNLYKCTLYSYIHKYNRKYDKTLSFNKKKCKNFFFNGKFASSIIFEITTNHDKLDLEKKNLNDYNVKVFFNNKLLDFFKKTKTLKNLYDVFDKNTFKDKNINDICGKELLEIEKKEDFDNLLFYFWFLFFLIFILFIYLITIIRKIKYIESKVTLVKSFGRLNENNKLKY